MISLDIGAVDTDSEVLGMLMSSKIKENISTHSLLSHLLLRKMPSDKFFNWLFAKTLPTNNQKQCQLHNKRKECVECVLGRFIPYIDTVLENNNKI